MLVELPGNQSANLRAYVDLTERAARRIRSARREALAVMALVEEAEDDLAKAIEAVEADAQDGSTALERFQDVCIVEAVTAWTLGDLPTLETVGDLAAETYAKLAELAVKQMAEPDFDASPDPKAPTDASPDLGRTSEAQASTQ